MAADNFTRGTAGGVVAGLVAGAVLFLFTGITSAATGGTFWLLPRGAAAPFFGAQAGAGAILVGLILHFAVSAVWGLLYGWTIFGQPKGVTMMAGAMWGTLVWALMSYAVAPLVGAGALITPQPLGRWFVMHVVWGVVLALAFLPFQARESRPGRVLHRRPIAA